MSTADVEKFFTSISRNSEALEKVAKDAADLDSLAANLARYAKNKGYDFTPDEARTWILQHVQQSADGALQDSQLEGIAGGVTNPGDKLGAVLKSYVERHRAGNLAG